MGSGAEMFHRGYRVVDSDVGRGVGSRRHSEKRGRRPAPAMRGGLPKMVDQRYNKESVMKRFVGIVMVVLTMIVTRVLAVGTPASPQAAPAAADIPAVAADQGGFDAGVAVQENISAAASPGTAVSFHKPDGMILSTGNLYFTSHDVYGASVFRMGQTSTPGQEITLYHEPPAGQFGDIVFAQVGGVYYGYFFAQTFGGAVIKRVLLTGSPTATVLTPPINNIDIVNSHHNLVTDGVNLYWQDVSAVKKMSVNGGAITTLDQASPNTPTAGVYLNNGNIIYASVNAVRYVPAAGAITSPLVRTIATANTTVTSILPVANGTYWGDRNGAIQLKLGGTVYTIQTNTGLVPTSMATNGYTAGGALTWTQCGSASCQMRFDWPGTNATFSIGRNALGAAMTSSGSVFWGDDQGIHRLY